MYSIYEFLRACKSKSRSESRPSEAGLAFSALTFAISARFSFCSSLIFRATSACLAPRNFSSMEDVLEEFRGRAGSDGVLRLGHALFEREVVFEQVQGAAEVERDHVAHGRVALAGENLAQHGHGDHCSGSGQLHPPVRLRDALRPLQGLQPHQADAAHGR